MRKKTEHNDSNMIGEGSTQMTLVDEVISRIPRVLLRIVFDYALGFLIVSEIASRWNAADTDGLITLIKELMQKAKVDAFYGKLLIELAYKDDKRFHPVLGYSEDHLQMVNCLVCYQGLLQETLRECGHNLSNIRPDLFSFRTDALTEEYFNAIEAKADVINKCLDESTDSTFEFQSIKNRIRVLTTPGVMECLRMILDIPRERTDLRLRDSLALETLFFYESIRDYQRCCRELIPQTTQEAVLHQGLPFTQRHWQMLERMLPKEQQFLIQELMANRQDQMLNVFSHAKASSSKSISDDKQPPLGLILKC